MCDLVCVGGVNQRLLSLAANASFPTSPDVDVVQW